MVTHEPSSRAAISIVIPTRARLPYLEVALSSIAPQAAQAGAEVVLVDDAGPSQAARELAARFGARYEPHRGPRGLNVARNTGVERSHGELIVFVDDDVRVRPGWLAALARAAREHPRVEVFAGRILASLEGPAPRSCGREAAPVTTLDLGERDGDARYAWGANMAIRRAALQRVGPFDASLEHGGDEQEWQERLRACTPGARTLYVADAAVEHRRAGADARLRALARGTYVRGMAARRFDATRAQAPPLRVELATLTGCIAHVLVRRCPAAITMVTHSWGRLHEGLRERAGASPSARAPAGIDGPERGARHARAGGQMGAGNPASDDFLSGGSGAVGGFDAVRREAGDVALDAWEILSARRLRLGLAARHAPPLRRVLALAVQRPQLRAQAAAIDAELLRSRHDVELHTCAPEGRGKFESLNALLREHPPERHDWLLVCDDDVALPHGFLDRLLFLCERFSLALAQPAHRLRSHAAWPVTRRRAGSAVRETAFVEIGPVTAFASSTFAALTPFPELRMGWGLDVHWAALAREHGWRCGVVDAVPIGHVLAPVAASYAHDAAVAEARAFLSGRPYLTAREADRTLATYRTW
jgi:GT2 family glycosyltransferase